MKKSLLLFILPTLLCSVSHAQDFGILYKDKEESLRAIIKNPKSNDTSLVAAHLILGEILMNRREKLSSNQLLEQTLSLADKFSLKNPPQLIKNTLDFYAANALFDLATFYQSEAYDTAKALEYYELAMKRAPFDKLLVKQTLSRIALSYLSQKNQKKYLETCKRFNRTDLKDIERDWLLGLAQSINISNEQSIDTGIANLKFLQIDDSVFDFKRKVAILLLEQVRKKAPVETVNNELVNLYAGRKLNWGMNEIINPFYVDQYATSYVQVTGLTYGLLNFYKQVGDTQSLVIENQHVGFSLRTQKLYDKALVYFKIAYEYALQTNNTERILINNHYIASTYRRIGNWDSTLARAKIGLELGTAYNDAVAVPRAYNEAGFAYYGLGNYSKALQSQLEGFKLKKTTEPVSAEYAYHTAEIARCYLSLHQLDSAKYYGLLTVEYIKNGDFVAAATNTYFIMSEIYAALKDWRGAYEMYKKHLFVTTQLVNTETTQQIVGINLTHDFEQRELLQKEEQKLKDELAKRDSAQKNTILGFISAGAVLLVFVILFVINRLRLTRKQKKIIEVEKNRSDMLLLNILPAETAEELKATGKAEVKDFNEVTVMFTDFKNFTQTTEKMTGKELVNEINYCFSEFDKIISKHGVEKIKTIGDSYMCAGGLPSVNTTHAHDVVKAALEVRDFILKHKQEKESRGEIPFEIRIGVHTGPVVAGIVGIKKFAYDIWGDTVNTASRMESSGEPGNVNVSSTTYKLVKDKFNCSYRGKVKAKNKGEIDMYFVESVS